jgi:hypothetical protein
MLRNGCLAAGVLLYFLLYLFPAHTISSVLLALLHVAFSFARSVLEPGRWMLVLLVSMHYLFGLFLQLHSSTCVTQPSHGVLVAYSIRIQTPAHMIFLCFTPRSHRSSCCLFGTSSCVMLTNLRLNDARAIDRQPVPSVVLGGIRHISCLYRPMLCR